MSYTNPKDYNLSKTLQDFLSDFEIAKKNSDISFLQYLREREILYNPIASQKESVEKIIDIGMFILPTSIYTDRFIIKKFLGQIKIFWRDIKRVSFRTNIVKRTVRGPLGGKHTKEFPAYFVDFILVDNSIINVDLNDLNGIGSVNKAEIIKQVIFYLRQFNPKAKITGMRESFEHGEVIDEIYRALETNYGHALELSIDFLAKNEKNVEAWKLITLALLNFMPSEALLFINTALSMNSNDPDILVVLGEVHESLNNKESAIDVYKKALIIEPNHTKAKKRYHILTDKKPESSQEKHDDDSKIGDYSYGDIVVNNKEIETIKRLIGDQKQVYVSHLESITGMYEKKIIKIATEELSFTLNNDILILKDDFDISSDHSLQVERVKHYIGSKKEVFLDYLEVILKIPRDELESIITNDLGLKIKGDKVIQ
ncbi:MAG: hypothetical protein FK734_03685 [Asgard group archaeon]|nr:hypothetical protein [Asgard group archaeon]